MKEKTEEYYTKEEIKKKLLSCRFGFKSWLPEEADWAIKNKLDIIRKEANKTYSGLLDCINNDNFEMIYPSDALEMQFDYEFLDVLDNIGRQFRIDRENRNKYVDEKNIFLDTRHYRDTGELKYIEKRDIPHFKRFFSKDYSCVHNPDDCWFALNTSIR